MKTLSLNGSRPICRVHHNKQKEWNGEWGWCKLREYKSKWKKSGLPLRARGRGLGISQGYHEGDPQVLSKNRRKKKKQKKFLAVWFPVFMCLLCLPSNLKSHCQCWKLWPMQFKKHTNSPLHEWALQIFLVTKTNYWMRRPHSEVKPARQTNQAQHV